MSTTLKQEDSTALANLGPGLRPVAWTTDAGVKQLANEVTPLPVGLSAAQIVALTPGPITSIKGAANENIVRQTSTGTAATLLIARPTRRSALIRNLDTANSVWLGPATVTTSNGFILKAGESLPITWVGLTQIIDDNTNHAAVAVFDEYD